MNRMMVYFRVDLAKYRTRIQRLPDGDWWASVRKASGTDVGAGFAEDPTYAMLLAVERCSGRGGKLQPHPWKLADGSIIKAKWEE